MYAGYIVEKGSCGSVLDTPCHPYTIGLIRSLPQDGDKRERLEPIPGAPPDLAQEIPGCPFAPRCALCTQLCTQQMPPIREWGKGHTVRCHHAAAAIGKRGAFYAG